MLLQLALAFPRTLQIAGQDEIVHYVGLGERLYAHGFSRPAELITFSPHLYGFALWLAHALCGPGLWVARLPGLAAWALTAVAVGLWLYRRAAAPSALASTAWALALLATAPMALQAAAIVDIDNTLLVPAILALGVSAVRFTDRPGVARAAAVAACLLVALWCRITTPILVGPILAAYAWRRRGSGAAAGMALALALGGALFLITWWAYGRLTGIDVAGPFRYLLDALVFGTVGADRGVRPGKIALTLAYLVLWLGPAFVALMAWLGVPRLWRLCRGGCPEPEDLLLVTGLAILAVYCLFGGTIFGFPKYHCPAVPLLLLAAAGGGHLALGSSGRAGGLAAVGLVLAGALLQVAVLGDPLLLLRLDLRLAVLHGQSARGLLWSGLVLPAILSAAVAVGLIALGRHLGRLSLAAGLLCLALGMNAGLTGLQQSGGYQTGYNYGDAGDARAAAAVLAMHLAEDDAAIVPGELVYLLQRPAVTHVPNELWSDAEALRRELARPAVGAAAVSLLTNTMAQLTTLTQVAAEDPDYTRVDIGHYAIFLRQPPPP